MQEETAVNLTMDIDNIRALSEANQNKPTDWEEPISFDGRELPVINTSAFPDWVRDYIEGVAEESQTPADASAMAAIATLSTVIAGKFVVMPKKRWTETLNTYSAMALDSANRKSAVFNRFLSPITAYEKDESERLKADIADQQSTIQAKKRRAIHLEVQYSKKGEAELLEEMKVINREIDEEKIIVAPRFITADATPEKLADLMYKHGERIAVMSAEGAEAFQMMAGRYSDNSNIDIYLKAHAADYVSVDRMGRDSIVLHNPTMTMGLFLQPSVIQDMPIEFQNRGLTQRFLYSLPKSTTGYRKREPEPMADIVEVKFRSNIKKLLKMKNNDDEQGNDDPIELKFDDAAYQYMLELEDEREIMLRDPDITEGFLGWLGKLTGQIIRIAALFHVADNVTTNMNDVPPLIPRSTLERANSLRDYFISHAEAAHGVMGANEGEEDAKYTLKRILEISEGKESIDYRNLSQLVKRRFRKTQELKEVLEVLEEMNYIRNERVGRKNIILINSKLIQGQKLTPITPNSTESVSLQGSNYGTGEIPSVPITPIQCENPQLGVMGTSEDEQSPQNKTHEVNGSEQVGVMGAHSKPSTNEIKISKDGSGLL